MALFETKFPADVKVTQALRVGSDAHIVGSLTVDGAYPTGGVSRLGVTGNATWTTTSTTHLGITGAGNLTLTLGELGVDFTSDTQVWIKDETEAANPTTAIKTIAAGGSDTIDGRVSISMTSASEAVGIYSDITNGKWHIF